MGWLFVRCAVVGILLASWGAVAWGQDTWLAQRFPVGERMVFEGRYGIISLGDAP